MSQGAGGQESGPRLLGSQERLGRSTSHLLSVTPLFLRISDTSIVPTFQMGKRRPRGKITMIMQPDANLNPVYLIPESVLSHLLNSIGDTPSSWLHFTNEHEEAQRGQAACPRSHSKAVLFQALPSPPHPGAGTQRGFPSGPDSRDWSSSILIAV